MSATISRLAAVRIATVGLVGALLAGTVYAQTADTAVLVESATSGTGQARYAAIDDLGELHQVPATVVPALQKQLGNSDPQVRWRSARALGDYGEQAQAAAPALRTLLADKFPVVQYHAAVTLGKIGDRSDETVHALVTAATGEDGRVARVAIAAIRQLHPGPEKVVGALQKALASNDNAVVVFALEAIVEHGAGAAPFLNEALKHPETCYLACTAIEEIGPDAADTVPALTALLGETKHSHLLIHALLALASIGPAAESAAPQIIPKLEMTTDATVPVAAAYALGSIGAAEADAPLRRAMAKPNAFLQMVAVWSLAKIHPDDARLKQQAVDKLQAGLTNEDPAIQAAAEKGLKLLEPPAEEAPTE